MGASNAMIVACTSSDPELNIFKVQEAVKAKGWDWNTILYPSGYVINKKTNNSSESISV